MKNIKYPLGFFISCLIACSNVENFNSTELPTRFENDRIILTPQLENGEVLEFYTDTGGGWNAINKDVALGLGLLQDNVTEAIPFPKFKAHSKIPANNLFMNGQLKVAESSILLNHSGFLGGRWFGDKVWEFDFLKHKLSLIENFEPNQISVSKVTVLGFQVKDKDSTRTMHFPRLPIKIDDKEIQMLFDTGATATVDGTIVNKLGYNSGNEVATSFIVTSIFNTWRKEHPEWRVIENADSIKSNSFAMIEVPKVKIGQNTVGPVWFTERPDSNFTDYMSEMMDKPISGALGGSGLKYFRVIVDYPNSKAYFFVK